MLIKADRSCLLVIDVQSRLAPAMHESQPAIANISILMKAAARLGVPMLVSQQYSKGLGPTVPELARLAPAEAVMEKLHFSCLGDDAFARRFVELGRDQPIVCGIEAHVCVLQTVLDLCQGSHHVFAVADAVTSRTPENAKAARERMAAAGASVVTTEMVIFEWLGRAGTPEFKDLSALIK